MFNKHTQVAKGPGPTTPNTLRITIAKDGTATTPASGIPDAASMGPGNATNKTLRVILVKP